MIFIDLATKLVPFDDPKHNTLINKLNNSFERMKRATMRDTFSCPLLTPEELQTVMISFDDIEHDTHGVKAVMERYGYCIVTSVLSADNDDTSVDGCFAELQSLETSINEDLSELIDTDAVRRGDSKLKPVVQKCVKQGVARWPSASLEAIGNRHRLQLKGLPHGRFAWRCRMYPKIRRVYEVLHETTDLVSSFDNSFVTTDTEQQGEEAMENRLWPHVDQNDHDFIIGHQDVYQGLLYCWPSSEPRSSTTVVWPRSHTPEVYDMYMNDAFLEKRGRKGNHFTAISMVQDTETRERLMQGWLSHARRVTVPIGGLLLWSSRTTHQGWSGGPRLAQPVCWEPRERRSAKARGRKLALAALGLPSTHSASLGQPHNLVPQRRPSVTLPERGSSFGKTVLPLKATIKSQALRDGEDALEVWDTLKGINLQNISLEHITYLELVLKDEFKAVV